jgi:predicted nucleic acid-binding protein
MRLSLFPSYGRLPKLPAVFKRREKHRRLELADCLIAATAFAEGATLATGNTKDWPMPEITVVNPII